MRKFDLEAAKRGEEVVTKGGDPVRIICFDKKCDKPIVALIEVDGKENVYSFTEDGFFNYSKKEDCDDLFMKPKTVTKWYNLYKERMGYYYKNEKQAITEAKGDESYICTRSVTWEE